MAATRTARKPRLSDEERDARVSALKAELDAAVASLDNEEVWEDLLRTISQFGSKYSFGNQLLIMVQSAQRGFDPKLVKAFGGWKSVNRSVIKGQRGLKIWAPNFRFPTAEEIEKAAAAGRPLRIDPETGRPAKILAGYRIEHVFDVCQTEGEPVEIPEPVIETIRVKRYGPRPELLEGEDIAGAWAAVQSLIEAHGYRVERGSCGGANGFTDPALRLVKVRDDVSPAQALKTFIHELAHIECSHVDDMAEYLLHRGRQETEAESVAYIVCGALGLDTGRYSAPYVRSWSEGKAEVITAAATMVVQAAGRILKGLEAAGLEASKRELVAA